METRQRVITLWKSGLKLHAIQKRFKQEGKTVSTYSLYKLIKKHSMHGKISDIKWQSRPSVLKTVRYEFIDKCMLENDELTAKALYTKLLKNFPMLSLSIETVQRTRSKLGWISTTPKYCQLIREINEEKRLRWCNSIDSNDKFEDVIWSDECSVQLNSHSLRCYRKKGQPKN